MVRIFTLWKNPIFHDSVRMILQHPQVEWVGDSSDPATIKNEILNLQPEIVLVEQTEEKEYTDILEILRTKIGMKIIAINLEDNQLWVFMSEKRTIVQARDLLKLVLPVS